MTVQHLVSAPFRAALLAASAGCAISLMAVSPATSLSNTQTMLVGGAFATAGATIFTAPGVPFAQLPTDFGNKGESFVQIRMVAGTASGLRAKVSADTVPNGGNFTVTVRKNGVDTTLACSLAGVAGDCTNGNLVAFATNDRLSIKIVNTLTNAGTVKLTFTLLYD
jgi:hypothetical protein